jgi:hypothetical protein
MPGSVASGTHCILQSMIKKIRDIKCKVLGKTFIICQNIKNIDKIIVLNCVLPYTAHEQCSRIPSKQEVANRRLRPRGERDRQFVTHDNKINYFTKKKKRWLITILIMETNFAVFQSNK